MRVCDYIAERLFKLGVTRVYGITGGGAAGLNDGFAKHGKIRWIGNHHEQASAFAAMGEAKLTGKIAVVNPTTGCGGTNCVTGVLDAWQDSVPILFISGNVNRAQMTSYFHRPESGEKRSIRKIGVQEADIIEIVAPITKYADTVNSPKEIVEKLEKAIISAISGRKGPVWLDVPTDIQTAEIGEILVKSYLPKFEVMDSCQKSIIEEAITESFRPLILVGAGAMSDRAKVNSFIQSIGYPFVCTYGAVDFCDYDNPLYVGRIGIKGDRAGNFAVSTCDLLIVLGSSLTTPITGYNLKEFAPLAKIIVVDSDDPKNMAFDKYYHYCRMTVFGFTSMLWDGFPCERWVEKCIHWKYKWPVCQKEYENETNGVNLYTFVNELSSVLPDKAAVVSDAGSAIYVPCQGLKLKNGQRHIISLAQSDMGWALPASIGVALGGVPTIVLTGDGSFQTNLQELATIRALNLPIKIFVWNNAGYLSIRATQNKLFDGRLMGTDNKTGLWFPDLEKIASAYEMEYKKIDSFENLSILKEVLENDKTVIVNVVCPPDQMICPTIGAKRGEDGKIVARPLFDMSPYLSTEEIEKERREALSL
jgi:acetolactate synthase I/II/III large subunit